MYGMDDVLICQDTWAGTSKVVYTAVSQLAQFFVPVIIVICLYLSIYLKLKNRPQVSFENRYSVRWLRFYGENLGHFFEFTKYN